MTSLLVWLGLGDFLGGRAFRVKSGTTDWMAGCLGRNVSAQAVQAVEEVVLLPPRYISALLPCHGEEALVGHGSRPQLSLRVMCGD